MISKRAIWGKWEEIATNYLINNWYEIIERNFQIKWWELDIIAKKNWKYIFFEVKYRKQLKFWTWEESLTKSKKNKIMYSINIYCLKNRINIENIEFDFLSIFETIKKIDIRHHRNLSIY